MNPGIFISYSRQDEKQAMHLLSLLRHEGYTVWIDQESIAGASIWSDEIVHNIKQSEIFIALISESSAASHNVSKEIAIAAEHGKIILPIEIGNVNLPGRLEYALAGIQRTSYYDEQAILHAVRSQVAKLSGDIDEQVSLPTQRARMQKLRMKVGFGFLGAVVLGSVIFFAFRNSKEYGSPDSRIVVLPFSTLNLEQDSTRNLDIFSEGIQTRLSKLDMLSLVSAAASSAYKNTHLNALAIAAELKARFIIEGIVRKAHDVNFVAVRIIDAKQGGEIWEQSYSGNAKELFNIREKVCGDIYGLITSVIGNESEIRNMEQNAAAHPNDAQVIAGLAIKLISTDKTRALNLFEKAIKLDTTNVAYLIYAGIIATRMEDGGRAQLYGKAAVALSREQLGKYPDSLAIATNYALALDMANEGVIAGKVFDSLLHSHPSDVRLLYNDACCYAKQGNSDRSLDILATLFPIAPGKRAEVQSDPDFDNIRSNPRYVKMIYGTGN